MALHWLLPTGGAARVSGQRRRSLGLLSLPFSPFRTPNPQCPRSRSHTRTSTHTHSSHSLASTSRDNSSPSSSFCPTLLLSRAEFESFIPLLACPSSHDALGCLTKWSIMVWGQMDEICEEKNTMNVVLCLCHNWFCFVGRDSAAGVTSVNALILPPPDEGVFCFHLHIAGTSLSGMFPSA